MFEPPAIGGEQTRPVHFERYAPKCISRQNAEISHHLGSYRQPFSWLLFGEQVTVTPRVADQILHLADSWLGLTLSSHGDVRLALPASLLAYILEQLLPGEDLERVAPELKLAFLEETFEPFLLQLEQATMRNLVVSSLAPIVSPELAGGLSVIVSGQRLGSHPVLLNVPEMDVPAVLSVLNHWCPVQPGNSPLAVRLSLRFGYTILPVREFFELRPGDAILLDAHLLSERKAVMVVEEMLVAPCLIDGELRVLTSPLVPAQDTMLHNWAGPVSQRSDTLMLSVPDEVSLRLDFDSWSGALDVNALEELNVGDQLPIGQMIDTHVVIKLAGHVVGAGEIIQLSERFALRVDHLRSVR